MNAEQLAEIQRKANLIAALIARKDEEVDGLTIGLEALQAQCPHEGVEVYRGGYKVGTCSTCRKKFSSKGQVDEIFST